MSAKNCKLMDFIFGYCCYNLIFIACEVDGFEPNRTLMLWSEILLSVSSCLIPVQFTEVPQNITVNRSTPLFLNCDATGFPEPKIRWEKSGIHLCGTKELNISSSNTHDAGEYVCIAGNGVRQEKTVRAYVTVQCKSFFSVFHNKLPLLLNPRYIPTYI